MAALGEDSLGKTSPEDCLCEGSLGEVLRDNRMANALSVKYSWWGILGQ